MNADVTTMYSHMKSKVIKIGNSRGVRISKSLLEEAKINDKIEISLTPEGLLIKPLGENDTDEWAALGLWQFFKDTDNPEEDEAWASLQ